MNKTMLSIALAALASAGFAQTPTFTQVARYNLGAFASGNVAGAVTFDGTNAYVASVANGGAGTTLYQIPNALNNTGQSATPFATQPNAAGTSRAADLVYANNAIYWGYGLGDNTATAGQTAWGITKYNLSGSVNASFGTGGTVSTSVGPARIDAMALDPLTGKLGVVANSRGFVWEIDPTTGASSNIGFATTPSTTWRSIAFDPAGNLYGRNDTPGTGINRWTRGSTFGPQSAVATYGTTSSAANRLAYVAGNGFDPILLANNFNSTSDPAVRAFDLTTNTFSTITGTENGLGTAFGNSAGVGQNFGLSSAVVNGSTYLFVAGISDAGGANTLAIYQVQAVPEPASLAALGLGAAAMLRRRRRA